VKGLLARLLLVGSVALVPALGFQVYTESEARRIRQHLVEDEALRLVRLVAFEQQQIVEGAEQVLNALSGSPAVQDNRPEDCRRLLANLLELSPRYINAAVIGLDGHAVCAPGPTDPANNASDRSYFRLALQTGGFAIGDYAIGRDTRQPTLHMAKPFRNRAGALAGVVEVALSIDWLAQQVGHLRLPPDAIISIADRNGTFLVRHPGQERYSGKPIVAAYRYILDGNEVALTRMISLDRGRSLIVAYSPPGADPRGLYIGVSLDEKTTFAAVTQANRTGLLLIFAGGGLALVITTLAGRHLIHRPFHHLLRVADRWRTGDLAARAGLPEDRSEFGRLAAAFDRMAGALQAREQALRMALESTTDGVLVLDRAWRFTYLNDHAKALIARGRDLLGLVVWEAFPGLAGTDFGDAYRAAMDQGVPTHAEGYYAPLDGYYEAHVYPSADGVTVFYHDLTAERRIAAELAGSNTRLSLAQEAAGIGIWEYDFASGALIWSPEQFRLHGLDPAAGPPSYEQWLELVHPDDRPAILAAAAAMQAPGSSLFRSEFRIRRGPDGELRWLAALGRLVAGEPGQPLRLVGVNLDVTDRRQAEDELQRAAALLNAIGTCSPDPIYAKDTEGRFLFANPAVLAVIGRPADQVIGRSDAEWHHDPAQAAAVMANDRRIIESGRMERLEETFDAAGLGLRVFRSAKAPLRTGDGRVLGIVAVSSDITQIKETEAALRESEERFRATFEQAAVGIAHLDLAGNWLRINDRLCEQLGYSRAELLAMNFRAVTYPDDLDTDLATLRRLVAGEIAAIHRDKRYLRKDGTPFWGSLTAALLRDSAGTPQYCVAVVENISERKRIEAELRQLTAELEARVRQEVEAREAAQLRAAHAERMQALGLLAGGIAHDFNNVLQAVDGAASLIERRPDDGVGVRRLARVAIEAIGRGASITRRLLVFGRRGDLRPETIDVGALLDGLREIFEHTLGGGIEVHVSQEDGLPGLFADKGQLETVLVNLATNARDAMPGGGRLTLSVETETVSAEGPAGLVPGCYIRFVVADTGIGMDATMLAHVGEPFFTTKPPGVGNGLGLPMAKGFAEQSGGALRIESRLGEGTTVSLWLPAAAAGSLVPAAPPADAASLAPGSPTTSARVLVVDDEDLVREMLAEALQDLGFTVLAAADGTEALGLLAAGEAVDILLTDLSMPGMDGLALIRAAQERRAGLPALLLTGYADDDAAIAFGGAVTGAFSLLRKPVRAQVLFDRIQALLAARANALR
jgi:PAS domain S-box-containing protein